MQGAERDLVRCRVPGHYESCSEGIRVCQLKNDWQLKRSPLNRGCGGATGARVQGAGRDFEPRQLGHPIGQGALLPNATQRALRGWVRSLLIPGVECRVSGSQSTI